MGLERLSRLPHIRITSLISSIYNRMMIRGTYDGCVYSTSMTVLTICYSRYRLSQCAKEGQYIFCIPQAICVQPEISLKPSPRPPTEWCCSKLVYHTVSRFTRLLIHSPI